MTDCTAGQSIEIKKDSLSRGLTADSWPMLVLMTATGGFSASYSFLARGGVFAFAQTGNIIYSGQVMASGHFWQVMTFLMPILSYMLGLFAAQQMEERVRGTARFQKTALLLESALMLITGLLPASSAMTRLSLCLLGCASGLQMQSFHRIGRNEYTSIMVMGNMKRTVEAFSAYLAGRQPASLHRAVLYVIINGIFCLGSAWGYGVTRAAGDVAILLPALLLVLAACILKE